MKYLYLYISLSILLVVFLLFKFWPGTDKGIKPTPLPTNGGPVLTVPPEESKKPTQTKPTPTQITTATPQISPVGTKGTPIPPTATPSPDSGSTPTPSSTPAPTSTPTPVPTPTPTPIKASDIQGLMAYWNLDEGSGKTMYDSSGLGITGQIYNINESVAWLSVGKISKALQFDGNDDYASVEDLPEIDFGDDNQSYSISLWVRKNGNPADFGGLVSKHDGIGISKYPFAIKILKNGKISFQISDGTNSPEILSDNPITDNKWKHIVAIRDRANNSLRLYIDNTLVSSMVTDSTAGSIKNDDRIYLGSYPFGEGFFYYDAPALDDIRLYSRALFENEVKALYDLGGSQTSLLDYGKYLLSLVGVLF